MKQQLFAYALLFGIAACQNDEIAPSEAWSEEQNCRNDFENQNNALATAPFAENGYASGLARNDTDYWQFKIAPNDKGKMPTHLMYELGSPTTVEVTVFRADTL